MMEEKKSEVKTYPNALITIDSSYGQIYVYLKPNLRGHKGAVHKTIKISNDVNIDLDEAGEVIGVEIL